MDGIGLADAIEMLRAEILTAQGTAAGKPVQFPIQTLTVELKVGLTKLADGKVGFKDIIALTTYRTTGRRMGANRGFGGKASESCSRRKLRPQTWGAGPAEARRPVQATRP